MVYHCFTHINSFSHPIQQYELSHIKPPFSHYRSTTVVHLARWHRGYFTSRAASWIGIIKPGSQRWRISRRPDGESWKPPCRHETMEIPWKVNFKKSWCPKNMGEDQWTERWWKMVLMHHRSAFPDMTRQIFNSELLYLAIMCVCVCVSIYYIYISIYQSIHQSKYLPF